MSGPVDSRLLDAVQKLARHVGDVAIAITPSAAPELEGRDEAGGTVTSLTEAVMGITAGLVRVADAISELADSVETIKESK